MMNREIGSSRSVRDPSKSALSQLASNPPNPMHEANKVNIEVVPTRDVTPTPNYVQSDESFVGARFILDCGRRLNLNALTIATAATLFHTFFKNSKKSNYDQYLIAAACIYLSGKLEETGQLKIRDLMNVVHSVLHPNADAMNLDSEYYNMREAICNAELLVLRMAGFKAKYDHPHKYLLHHLKSLKAWISEDVWDKYPIASTSWSILQDFYHDPRVLQYDRSHISVACISLALQTYGIQIPYINETSKKSWYSVFSDSLTKESLWELMAVIMDVYNNEESLIPRITKMADN